MSLELPELISQKAVVWPCAKVLRHMEQNKDIHTLTQPPPRKLSLHLCTLLIYSIKTLNREVLKQGLALCKVGVQMLITYKPEKMKIRVLFETRHNGCKHAWN